MNCGNSRQFDKVLVYSILSELQNVPNFEMRFVFKIDVAVKQPPTIISYTLVVTSPLMDCDAFC